MARHIVATMVVFKAKDIANMTGAIVVLTMVVLGVMAVAEVM